MPKMSFLESACFKTWRFIKISRSIFLDQCNAFSILRIVEKVKSKKKSCDLVPKVMIDLPFEGRLVEGSWKYRRRERVPQAGSRWEETISAISDFFPCFIQIMDSGVATRTKKFSICITSCVQVLPLFFSSPASKLIIIWFRNWKRYMYFVTTVTLVH